MFDLLSVVYTHAGACLQTAKTQCGTIHQVLPVSGRLVFEVLFLAFQPVWIGANHSSMRPKLSDVGSKHVGTFARR